MQNIAFRHLWRYTLGPMLRPTVAGAVQPPVPCRLQFRQDSLLHMRHGIKAKSQAIHQVDDFVWPALDVLLYSRLPGPGGVFGAC